MRRGAVGAVAGAFLLLFAASAATSASTTAHPLLRWRVTRPKLPADAAIGSVKGSGFGAISCGSPGYCTAVGGYIRHKTAGGWPTGGLLLTEKAGQWNAGVEPVLPANAAPNPNVYVSSVSCASAGNCTAVGTYGSGSGGIYGEGSGTEGLLLTEKAGRWAPGVEALLPADAASDPEVNLTSVSCASAGNCTAVGTYYTSSGGIYNEGGVAGVLLTENAGKWKKGLEAPLPSDADTSRPLYFPAVSCSSDGRCSAVGTYNIDYGRDSEAGEGVLLTEKGGQWRAIKAVMPPDGPGEGIVLTSVSCAAAGNCSAIGIYNINIDSGGGDEGVLLNEKAGEWQPGVRAIPPKNVISGYWENYVGPLGISCPSPGACVAVGEYQSPHGGDLTVLTEKAGTWQQGVDRGESQL
jgi:hypothetical protein